MTAPAAAARRFDRQRIWHLSPEAFSAAADLLAAAVPRTIGPVAAIIEIAAGGLPLGGALAARLAVPAFAVRARHNATDAIYTPATGQVSCDPTDLPSSGVAGKVLVADDICGSGATIRAVLTALRLRLPEATPHTAVLCRNTGADLVPDLWVWDVSDWVVFSWEPTPADLGIQALPPPTGVRVR